MFFSRKNNPLHKNFFLVGSFLLFLVLFFVPAQSAKAVDEICVWNASVNQNMSNPANWYQWGTSDPCVDITPDDDLFFDGTVDTNATWDTNFAVQIVWLQSGYDGTVTVGSGISATSSDTLAVAGGTFSLDGGNLSVNNLSIQGGNTTGFYMSTGSILNVNADMTVSAGFGGFFSSSPASNVYLLGTGNLGGGGSTNIGNLIISGNYTLAGDINIGDGFGAGALTISQGGVLNGGSGKTITLSGASNSFIINGTFNADTSAVWYYSVTPIVATTTYHDLIIASLGATIDGNVTTTGAFNTYLSNSSSVVQNSGTVIMTGNGSSIGGGGSMTLNNLLINPGVTVTLNGTVTSTNIMVDGVLNDSGSYTVILTGSGTPFVVNGSFSRGTSRVIYSGSGTTNIATTTYYNLTINSNDAVLVNNVNVSSTLTINNGKSLNADIYAINLSATGTPFINNGNFISASSTLNYTSTGSVTTTGGTYWNLELGGGTYLINDNTTSTNSFTNSGTTTIASGKTLYVPNTFDNNGTITETGAIVHPLTSAKLSDNAGTEKSSYVSGSDTVYITVEDSDGNLNATATDTIAIGTGSTITTDGYNDSESISSITLTETGVDTGIFVGTAYPFQVVASKTNNNSKFDVSGSGTLTLAFVDSKDATDTGADTASFTGSTYSAPVVASPGGGGGGGAPAPSAPMAPITLAEPIITQIFSITGDQIVIIGNEKHIVKVNKVDAILSEVTFTIQSTPITFKLKINEEKLLDTDRDNLNDLRVKLNAISMDKKTVDLSIVSIDDLQVSINRFDVTTDNRDVILYLNSPLATQMAISESPLLSGASFEPYRRTKTWRLSAGLGVKKIYVKFRTAQGGAKIVSSEIVLVDKVVATPTLTKTNIISEEEKKFIFKKNLSIGMSNNDVKELQLTLKKLGFLKITKATKYYGVATREAVKKFQKSKKIKTVNGKLDTKTREWLNNL